MPDGDGLRDHAAHRYADDVRALDVQGREQPDGIVGHVLQSVRGVRCIAAHEFHRVGSRNAGEVRGEPDVAVVEADHVEARRG